MESVSNQKTGKIQSLAKDDVHRICSGQVILNLSIAVKELIENSLDAESTNIDIRLREYGKEMIEVIDNGNGIHEENFQSFALKHHTSKLRNFTDISSVDTFGFRGEAISSLCALSNLVVTTRHSSSSHGTRIVFDRNGLIREQTPSARQIGTTACLTDIFSTLPVRQKEFHRNIKKEFTKMTQLVSAYCLMSLGVKITCSNYTKRDGKISLLSTEGSKSLKENISMVFGSKQLNSLIEIPKCEVGNEEYDDKFEIEGFISHCENGKGRSSSDRQFYYVNYRPCEYPKLSRTVNEVYHRFNHNQYPFVALNIIMDKSSIDINVTPDKRKIFIQNEHLLMDAIKNYLLKLYENTMCTFKVNSMPSTEVSQKRFDFSNFKSFSVANKRLSVDELNTTNLKQQKLDCMYSYTTENLNKRVENSEKGDSEGNEGKDSENQNSEEHEGEDLVTEQENRSFSNQENRSLCDQEKRPFGDQEDRSFSDQEDRSFSDQEKLSFSNQGKFSCIGQENLKNNESDETKMDVEIFEENYEKENMKIREIQENAEIERNFKESLNKCEPTRVIKEEFLRPMKNCNVIEVTNLEREVEMTSNQEKMECSQTLNIVEIIDDTEIIGTHHGRKCVMQQVDMNVIKRKLKKLKNVKLNRNFKIMNKFHAEIDPSSNELAECELSKEITKDMFSQMEIIGQFNLGFIITRLDQDLFIVDQHASDEKYNFEMLQKNTVLTNQKLVIPQNLELTAINESVLIDNIDIIRRSGFEFHIDTKAVPTKKVKLTGIPICKNWEFGKEDINEMLFMLQDAPGVMCRPSRVRTMFASQACRKSIMIGTALSVSDMRQLIDHMEEMDQPWNCPHGRPTMRHLVNISLLS